MFQNTFCKGRAYKSDNFFLRSGCNAGNTAEMHDQTLLRLRTDTLDAAQDRLHLSLAAQLSMEGNAKPMGLIPYMLKHLQSRRIPVNKHRIRVPYPIYFLHALGKSYKSNLIYYSQLRKSLICE